MNVPLGGQGGVILISTDVNALAGAGIAGRLAARIRTAYQRLRKDHLVDQVILQHLARAEVAVGWSIGPTLFGRYYDPEERILYLERSFAVEILDAPYPVLKAIAKDLRQTFRQQEVILKCHETGVVEHVRGESP